MEVNRIPTHIMLPNARIMVQSKNNPAQYAWATNLKEFEAALQERGISSKEIRLMRFFLAMEAFMVFYPQHNRRITYPEGTNLYAFPNPQDKLVIKMSKPSQMRQGRLL